MKYYLYTIFLFYFLSSSYSQEFTDPSKNLRFDTLGIYDLDLLPSSFHADRRKALKTLIPSGGMAVFYSGKSMVRANDVDYEFHQDPSFYYLTGLNEPNSALIIFKKPQIVGIDTISELLLIKERNENAETWVGKKLGVEGSELVLGIQKSLNIDKFTWNQIDFSTIDTVFINQPFKEIRYPDLDSLRNIFNRRFNHNEITNWMAKLREVKTKEELVLLRKAISITCDAQNELMKVLKPEMKEFQAEAVVEAVFKINGAEYPGYPSIVGAAENSCILHYTTNRKTMKGNHLLLSDVGAEYHGYTADVTRTIPVDGKYSKEEKIIYNIVLEAQNKAIAECKAGNPFYITNTIATTVVSQRLQEIGLIKSPFELRRYFMHGTSHYLGLDVHDPGTYGEFQPNTVITVEPGIYIKEGSPCDPKWWNIGVRIEDDILITDGEPENLSGCVPRTIKEIEAVMKKQPLIFKDF
jgi:Xaa-Pro aminopeptidase